MTSSVVMRTELPGLPPPRRGKVRDIYDLGNRLLIAATDRISAFDVVMATGIPKKGRILTAMSAFWFCWIERKFPALKTHFISTRWSDIVKVLPQMRPFQGDLEGRLMLVEKATRLLPVEAVVRGYLFGSAWREYCQNGRVCELELPLGLKMADQLANPIFTPATKAETGHDQNISLAVMGDIVGGETACEIVRISQVLYSAAARYAAERGVIIADTKFEFGLDDRGQIMLIDEVFTPDSSRFWPRERWQPGQDQPSLDKQFLREYLERLVGAGKWNKEPPGPELPEDIVETTRDRYVEALERLMRGSLTE